MVKKKGFMHDPEHIKKIRKPNIRKPAKILTIILFLWLLGLSVAVGTLFFKKTTCEEEHNEIIKAVSINSDWLIKLIDASNLMWEVQVAFDKKVAGILGIDLRIGGENG